MAINGQVGNSTNLSDQNGSSVLSFEELGHGQANNYLPGKDGRFLITGVDISSSVSSVSIQNGLDQATILEIEFIMLKPATDDASLELQFYESGVLESGTVYDRATFSQDIDNTQNFSHSSNDTAVELKRCGNDTYEFYNGQMVLFHAKDGTRQTNFMHKGFATRADSKLNSYQVWGELPQASAVDGIKVFFDSGNIESGKIKVYGWA